MSSEILSKKGFESFFRENYPAVYAFLKRYVNDEELAADIAQETFIRVYERRKEITSIEYSRAFLYTVARNLYRNHCKHLNVEKQYCIRLDEADLYDYDFLNEVTHQETVRVLYTAVDALPPQTRRVILLNLKGKNNQEIAEELKISVNTVKYLKKSAYSKLKSKMSKHYFLLLLFWEN